MYVCVLILLLLLLLLFCSAGPRVTIPADFSGPVDAPPIEQFAAPKTIGSMMIPLAVTPTVLPVPAEVSATLGAHLVLIFSGQPRLAKYLLQSVLGRWYSRHPDILPVVDGLCATAARAAAHVVAGDLVALGAALYTYWAQKKRMATDAEPPFIAAMLAKLRPHAHGMALMGAGGGGFVCVRAFVSLHIVVPPQSFKLQARAISCMRCFYINIPSRGLLFLGCLTRC